jgi:hypothetical protein
LFRQLAIGKKAKTDKVTGDWTNAELEECAHGKESTSIEATAAGIGKKDTAPASGQHCGGKFEFSKSLFSTECFFFKLFLCVLLDMDFLLVN